MSNTSAGPITQLRIAMARRRSICSGAVALFVPSVVLGHAVERADGQLSLYSGSALTLTPLVLIAALYARGAVRLWRRAGVGHGLSIAHVVAFSTALMALFAATVWPLDALGEFSLAAHVGQHMVLLAVVAPLLGLGHPMGAMVHALPSSWVRRIAGGLRPLLSTTRNLAAATLVHIAVMWIWHLPGLTAAALDSEALHWTMHLSFLFAGLWFWATIAARHADATVGAGAALLALVAVMMQMGLIGALLCFASQPLYGVYVDRVAVLGLDPMSDQQLAGLIMWVPACLPYLIGAWVIVVARLGTDDKAESRVASTPAQARR